MEISVWILVLNIFGYPSTILMLWFNWKSDIVFLLMTAFWLFKLIRGIRRWMLDEEERKIELKEKRKRYDKDIFS